MKLVISRSRRRRSPSKPSLDAILIDDRLSLYGLLFDNELFIVHLRTMYRSASELICDLGSAIKARRVAIGFTQADAAERSGVAYRTWRRMEQEGKASIEDLARAAIALRCEDGLVGLFPMPVAASMEDLMRAQQKAVLPKRRLRAPSRRAPA